VFVSGGEPTIHPDLWRIIEVVYEHGAEHVVLISNGRRFAEEPHLVRRLKKSFPELEVFLQFDTFDADLLVDLRGVDLSDIRREAIKHLAAAGVYTTLVAIVKEGQSIDEIGATVEFALTMPNIRGVQFQPLRATGRHAEGTPLAGAAPTVGGVVRALSDQLDFVSPADVIPHPLAPGTIAVGYWDRKSRRPITSAVVGTPSGHLPNLIAPPPMDQVADDPFRVLVVCYLDKFNWRSDLVSNSPIQVLTRSGVLMPLDLYYLFGESTPEVRVELTSHKITRRLTA
jgi:hypothetical protein